MCFLSSIAFLCCIVFFCDVFYGPTVAIPSFASGTSLSVSLFKGLVLKFQCMDFVDEELEHFWCPMMVLPFSRCSFDVAQTSWIVRQDFLHRVSPKLSTLRDELHLNKVMHIPIVVQFSQQPLYFCRRFLFFWQSISCFESVMEEELNSSNNQEPRSACWTVSENPSKKNKMCGSWPFIHSEEYPCSSHSFPSDQTAGVSSRTFIVQNVSNSFTYTLGLFMHLHFSIGCFDCRRTTRFRQSIHFSRIQILFIDHVHRHSGVDSRVSCFKWKIFQAKAHTNFLKVIRMLLYFSPLSDLRIFLANFSFRVHWVGFILGLFGIHFQLKCWFLFEYWCITRVWGVEESVVAQGYTVASCCFSKCCTATANHMIVPRFVFFAEQLCDLL